MDGERRRRKKEGDPMNISLVGWKEREKRRGKDKKRS